MAEAAASGGVSTPMTRQAPAAGHKGRAGGVQTAGAAGTRGGYGGGPANKKWR